LYWLFRGSSSKHSLNFSIASANWFAANASLPSFFDFSSLSKFLQAF
jgi:hypothetical protein